VQSQPKLVTGQPEDQQSRSPTPAERLRSLAALHDDGLITDDEFEAKKAALLDEL
jgi:hypothetical protein